MSLNNQQVAATIQEFEENVAISGLTLAQIAEDLQTNAANIERILKLQTNHIEEPWIVRNYLLAKNEELGKESVPFSALVGDYHQYWFLNVKKIERQKIGHSLFG